MISEYDRRWSTPVRHLLLQSHDEKYRKELKVKRRRMINFFGGYEGIKEVSVTVVRLRNIVGVRVSVSSRFGKPGVRNTESFITEPRIVHDEEALFYGLMLPIQLKLQGIKTIVYYETRLSNNPTMVDDPLFSALRRDFLSLTFVSTDKGPIFENIRQRIRTQNRNEVIKGYLSDVRARFESARHGPKES